jgi:hypothetical protein
MSDMDIEELRRKLLAEVYAISLTGMPAVILDEDRIKRADADELLEIAKRFGFE